MHFNSILVLLESRHPYISIDIWHAFWFIKMREKYVFEIGLWFYQPFKKTIVVLIKLVGLLFYLFICCY